LSSKLPAQHQAGSLRKLIALLVLWFSTVVLNAIPWVMWLQNMDLLRCVLHMGFLSQGLVKWEQYLIKLRLF
jgi:hypothetical protein